MSFEEAKDQVALLHRYENYTELRDSCWILYPELVEGCLKQAAELYAKSEYNKALEDAAEKAEVEIRRYHHDGTYKATNCGQEVQIGEPDDNFYIGIDKESILSLKK